MKFTEYLQEKRAKFDNIVKSINLSEFKPKRLRYCNAQVYSSYSYTILRSYNTIVAIYDHYDDALIVRGYYSATTQKHIALFINDFCSRFTIRYNCYADSKKRVIYGANWGEVKVDTKDNLYYRNTQGEKVLYGF